MSDWYGNPLAPQQGANVIQNPTPEQQSDLAGQWRNFMAGEANRAALLQFGTAMMQPVGLGQTPAGHFGQALGQAGEALTRRGEIGRKEQDASSKEELRSAQATLAESRAANAGTAAARAGDRLEIARERLAFDRDRIGTQNLIRLQSQYQRAVEKLNADNTLLPRDRQQAIPNFNDWLKSNPELVARLGVAGAPPPLDTGDGGASPPTSSSPQGGGATPPVSSLKEGVNTRFRNGQVWTLRNGQPTQVQ